MVFSEEDRDENETSRFLTFMTILKPPFAQHNYYTVEVSKKRVILLNLFV